MIGDYNQKPPTPAPSAATTDWWWRPDSRWGPGEWLCSRCHPNPNKEAEVTAEKQPELLTEVQLQLFRGGGDVQ